MDPPGQNDGGMHPPIPPAVDAPVSRLSGTGIVECLEIITGVVIHFTIDLG